MSNLSLDKLLKKAENKLQNVHEMVQEKSYELIRQAYKESIFVEITEGFRSIEQQHKLYSQGRTTPGIIVTNAKGGYSYHNYGLAFDIALLDNNGEVDWTIGRKKDRVGMGRRLEKFKRLSSFSIYIRFIFVGASKWKNTRETDGKGFKSAN